MKTTRWDSFDGKLMVMLESLDADPTPDGTKIAVRDGEGILTDAGEGWTMLHWADKAGHNLVVQWPTKPGWSNEEVAAFAAGVTVTSEAQPTRG